MTPVEDESLRGELADVLDRSFADNTNAWELGADGYWSRRTTNGDQPRNVQDELLERHADAPPRSRRQPSERAEPSRCC